MQVNADGGKPAAPSSFNNAEEGVENKILPDSASREDEMLASVYLAAKSAIKKEAADSTGTGICIQHHPYAHN